MAEEMKVVEPEKKEPVVLKIERGDDNVIKWAIPANPMIAVYLLKILETQINNMMTMQVVATNTEPKKKSNLITDINKTRAVSKEFFRKVMGGIN